MQQQPTEYEQYLMEYLGFHNLQQLTEFLDHPSWGCLDMQVPPLVSEALGEPSDRGQA